MIPVGPYQPPYGQPYSERLNPTRMIVVLSGRSVEQKEGRFLPSAWLKERLEEALNIWRSWENADSKTFWCMSGGDGGVRAWPSSRVMRDYAKLKGVPNQRIFEDSWALNTHENALFSREIIHEFNQPSSPHFEEFGPCVEAHVVSSDFHMERVEIIFRHYFEGPGTQTIWQNSHCPRLIFYGSKTVDDNLPNLVIREKEFIRTLTWYRMDWCLSQEEMDRRIRMRTRSPMQVD